MSEKTSRRDTGEGFVARMAARSWRDLWGVALAALGPGLTALADARGLGDRRCIEDPLCTEPEHLLPPPIAYGLTVFSAVMLLLVLAAMWRKLD